MLFNPRLEQVLSRSSSTGRVPPAEVERLWWVFQRNRPTRAELETLGFDSVYVMDQRAHLAGPLPRLDSPGPITSRGMPELTHSAFRPAAAGQRCDKADGSLRPRRARR